MKSTVFKSVIPFIKKPGSPVFILIVTLGMSLNPGWLSRGLAQDPISEAAEDGLLTEQEIHEIVRTMEIEEQALLTEEEIDMAVARLEAEGWVRSSSDVEPATSSNRRGVLQLRVHRDRVIHLPTTPDDSYERDSYEALSPEHLQKFQQRRQKFLAAAATILSSTRLFYGIGSLVRNQVRQVFKRGSTSVDPLAQLSGGVESGGRSLRELRWQAIESVLKNLDQTLVRNARIVSMQNEFSVSASLALIGEAGVGQRGIGGSAGIGVSFGFNSERQAVVFEIFSEIEKLERAITPTAQIGLVPRIGVNVYNQISGEEMGARRGQTVYPPLAYVSATPDLWAVGATTSLMAFPPILPEFMVYTHKIVRRSMLRVLVSPVMPGWLRVNLGGWPRRARWTLQPVAPVARTLQDSNWPSALKLTCESLF